MRQIQVYTRTGAKRVALDIYVGSSAKFTLMKEDYILLKFKSKDKLTFQIGDYINVTDHETLEDGTFVYNIDGSTYDGTDYSKGSIMGLLKAKVYELTDNYMPSYDSSTGAYTYELKFNGYYFRFGNKNLKNIHVLKTATALTGLVRYKSGRGYIKRAEDTWTITCKFADVRQIILDNMYVLGTAFAKVYGNDIDLVCDAAYADKTVVLSFNSTSILDAMVNLAEAMECEFWADGNTIHFGKVLTEKDVVEVKQGIEAKSITSSNSKGRFATRIYAYGSTRNVPTSYRKKLEFTNESATSRTDITDKTKRLKAEWFSQSLTREYKKVLETTTLTTRYFLYDRLYVVSGNKIKIKVTFDSLHIWTLRNMSIEEYMKQNENTAKTLDVNVYACGGGGDVVGNKVKIGSVTLDKDDFVFDYNGGWKYKKTEIEIECKSGREDTYNVFMCNDIFMSSSELDGFSFGVMLLKNSKVEVWSMDHPSIGIQVVVGSRTLDAVFDKKKNGDNTITLNTAQSGNLTYTVNGLIDSKVDKAYYTSEESSSNSVAENRLMLPASTNGFVDAYEGMNVRDVIEDAVIFEDVYPKKEDEVDDVKTYDYTATTTDEDGNEKKETKTAYLIKSKYMSEVFSKEYINSEDGKLYAVFSSGALNGLEFEVVFSPQHGDDTTEEIETYKKYFEIIYNETYGRLLPDSVLYPKAGDKFTLYGYDASSMSSLGLVAEAEAKLKEEAEKYIEKAKYYDRTYNVVLNPSFIEHGDADTSFELGDKFKIENPTFFEASREVRIIGYDIKLDFPQDYPTFTLGEMVSYSKLSDLDTKLKEVVSKVSSGAGAGSGTIGLDAIIGTEDDTKPSDSNVYSALRTEASYLSKEHDDGTNYDLNARNFISDGKVKGQHIEGNTAQLNDVRAVNMIADNLKVYGSAHFFELVIDKIRAAGGAVIYSPADGFVVEVVEDKGTKYRLCWRSNDNEGNYRYNTWVVNDQALCKTFNKATVGTSVDASNKEYWALVTGVSTDNSVEIIDGVGYHWIEISKSTKTGTLNPEVGDNISMLGHRGTSASDVARQGAIYIAAYDGIDEGLQAPFICQYTGINDFSLSSHRYSYLSRGGNMLKGDLRILNQGGEEKELSEWTIGDDGYWYKDGVKTDTKATGTPGEPGEKGDKGDTGEPGGKGDTGDQGEPGNDALNIVCSAESLVYVTGSDGLVPTSQLSSNYVDINVYKSGSASAIDTSKLTYTISATKNCTAAKSTGYSNRFLLTSITKKTLSDGTKISSTSGSLTVKIEYQEDANRDRVTLYKTITFAVSVESYVGEFTIDEKALKSSFSELTNNGAVTSLVSYKSEILQTARNISLSVSSGMYDEGLNLIPSTAWNVGDGRWGWNGVETLTTTQTREIAVGGGYVDGNALHVISSGATSSVYLGIHHEGVDVKANTKYTLNLWVKAVSKCDSGYGVQILFNTGTNSTIIGASTTNAFAWTRKSASFTTPEGCTSIDVLVFMRKNGEMYFSNLMMNEGEEVLAWSVAKDDCVEGGLKRTGIDIANGRIEMQADDFVLKNNDGVSTLSADANHNVAIHNGSLTFKNGEGAPSCEINANNDGLTQYYYPNGNKMRVDEWVFDGENVVGIQTTYYKSDGSVNWVLNENGVIKAVSAWTKLRKIAFSKTESEMQTYLQGIVEIGITNIPSTNEQNLSKWNSNQSGTSAYNDYLANGHIDNVIANVPSSSTNWLTGYVFENAAMGNTNGTHYFSALQYENGRFVGFKLFNVTVL